MVNLLSELIVISFILNSITFLLFSYHVLKIEMINYNMFILFFICEIIDNFLHYERNDIKMLNTKIQMHHLT